MTPIIVCILFQVIIITGGAGGIGSGVAARFLSDGASVAILDLNQNKIDALVTEELREWSDQGRLKGYAADVSKRENCFHVVDQVVKDFGKVNFLFNAVAYFRSSV